MAIYKPAIILPGVEISSRTTSCVSKTVFACSTSTTTWWSRQQQYKEKTESQLQVGMIRTTFPVAHLSFHLSSLSSSHRLGTMAAVAAPAAAAAEAAASSSVLFDEVCLQQIATAVRDAFWDAARGRGRRNTPCSDLRVWANMALLS